MAMASCLACLVPSGAGAAAQADGVGTDDAVAAAREQARGLQSPLPYTEDAIREGRKSYLRLCQNCHGRDGRALESFDFEATDLTDPERYRHGATDGDLFFSIKSGAGNDMPPFAEKLDDQQVWQVVWFLRSLGPESARPTPAEAPAAVPADAPAPPAGSEGL